LWLLVRPCALRQLIANPDPPVATAASP